MIFTGISGVIEVKQQIHGVSNTYMDNVLDDIIFLSVLDE